MITSVVRQKNPVAIGVPIEKCSSATDCRFSPDNTRRNSVFSFQ